MLDTPTLICDAAINQPEIPEETIMAAAVAMSHSSRHRLVARVRQLLDEHPHISIKQLAEIGVEFL